MAAGPTPSSSSNSTIIETDSTPNDLIKPEVVNQQVRKTADSSADPGPAPRRNARSSAAPSVAADRDRTSSEHSGVGSSRTLAGNSWTTCGGPSVHR
ncbi:hypothetical protein ACFQ51_45750 [Streptomyces kaempferi]